MALFRCLPVLVTLLFFAACAVTLAARSGEVIGGVVSCKSLDFTLRTMSDFAFYLTADMIGEGIRFGQ